jgi:hypothetical protein
LSAVAQFEIVILSKPLLRSEGSGKPRETPRSFYKKRRGVAIARLARFLFNFKLSHYRVVSVLISG